MILILDRNTELARAVDDIIAQAKRIYIMIKVKTGFFHKRNSNYVCRVFIETTSGSLGEHKKLAFFVLPSFCSCGHQTIRL